MLYSPIKYSKVMELKKGNFEHPNKKNLPAMHQSNTTRNLTLRNISNDCIINNNKDIKKKQKKITWEVQN